MPFRAADPTLWFNFPGTIAAYQPIAGPDPLTVCFNMSHGGDARNPAVPGVFPTWSCDRGWTFNGSSQYFTTGIMPAGDQSWSAIIRYAGATANDGALIGCYNLATNDAAFLLQVNSSGMYSYNGSGYPTGFIGNGPAQTSGIYAICGRTLYRNGVADPNMIPNAPAGRDLRQLFIGTFNGGHGSDAPGSLYLTGNIQAIAVYDRTLTPAEAWLAAQQMAYCEYNAWSVWSPMRRWFFRGPPVVAATPVLSTVYLNTADVGDTSLFDGESGTGFIRSDYARTGANSFGLRPSSDYLLANLTSSATKYTRFGLLVSAAPPATARICAWLEDGTEHVSLWMTDGLQLEIRQGSTVIQTSPTTLELGIWYCIEAKVVVHTTTGRFQVRIDNVDDMSAIGICTDADVDGAINQIQFESPVGDTYFDDIMVREDGWCGTGGVYVVVPTMDGTVRDWASGGYAAIAETPPTFDEYIQDGAGGGHTQLVSHSGVGDLDVNVVGVFALGRADESADVTFQAAARSILTDNVGYAQELDTIGVYARLLMTTDPNGNVAWTVHAVNNALQLGVKS